MKVPLFGKYSVSKFALVSPRIYERVSSMKWRLTVNGYVCCGEIYLHRFVTDAPKGMDVDHINFDRTDCRDENLRVVPPWRNRQHMRKRNTSHLYKGVRMRNGKFCARIKFQGEEMYLGRRDTAEEAARLYDYAADVLFDDMAVLNFPREASREPTC